MDKEQLMNLLQKITENKDFMLNPDKEKVGKIVEGLLQNEKRFKLRLCPCRLRDGTRERDLQLLCPCKFKEDEAWKNLGRCTCNLFVKRSL